jgi:hypothetical protein
VRACFADNAQLPIACSHDIGETYNCLIATSGTSKYQCQYWRPDLAAKLCQEILGDEWRLVKHEVICAKCGLRQDGPTDTTKITF